MTQFCDTGRVDMQPHTSKVFLSLTCATLWVSVVRAAFKRVGIGIYVLNVGGELMIRVMPKPEGAPRDLY